MTRFTRLLAHNYMDLLNFDPTLLGSVPIVLGLVELIKRAGLSNRYAPIVSVVLGIGSMFLLGQEWQSAVMNGIFVGLSASGLWSSTKTVAGY